MPYIYSDPSLEASSPHTQPDIEVFYADRGEWSYDSAGERCDYYENVGLEPNEAGYYFWPCFPGCLPDGEPEGPYATQDEAIEAARDLCA